jgi:hypothetical protein
VAEVAIPRILFADILRLVSELRPPPAVASTWSAQLFCVRSKTNGEVRLDDDQTRIFGARRADVTGVGAWEPPCRGIGIAKILKKLTTSPRQGCHPVDVEAEIAAFDRFWQCQFLARSSRAFKPVTLVRRAPKIWILLSSRRISILFLIGPKQSSVSRRYGCRRRPQFRKDFALLKKPYGGIMAALMARPSGNGCSML